MNRMPRLRWYLGAFLRWRHPHDPYGLLVYPEIFCGAEL